MVPLRSPVNSVTLDCSLDLTGLQLPLTSSGRWSDVSGFSNWVPWLQRVPEQEGTGGEAVAHPRPSLQAPPGRGDAYQLCKLPVLVENQVSLLRNIRNISLRDINILSTSCDFAILCAFHSINYSVFILKLGAKDETGTERSFGGLRH